MAISLERSLWNCEANLVRTISYPSVTGELHFLAKELNQRLTLFSVLQCLRQTSAFKRWQNLKTYHCSIHSNTEEPHSAVQEPRPTQAGVTRGKWVYQEEKSLSAAEKFLALIALMLGPFCSIHRNTSMWWLLLTGWRDFRVCLSSFHELVWNLHHSWRWTWDHGRRTRCLQTFLSLFYNVMFWDCLPQLFCVLVLWFQKSLKEETQDF